MSLLVSVVIPVGPKSYHQDWLPEAIESCVNQSHKPEEILIVSDMAHIGNDYYHLAGSRIRVYESPWRLGVGHAFNFGVALARNNLVVMLGADDTLESTAVEEAVSQYRTEHFDDAYYYFGLRYMDTGELQDLPCNAAMVTKRLWDITGGFPVEATTAPDAALISILLRHRPAKLIKVAEGRPLYNYRRHPNTDTAKHGGWNAPAENGIIIGIRDRVTLDWEPPTLWGRRLQDT